MKWVTWDVIRANERTENTLSIAVLLKKIYESQGNSNLHKRTLNQHLG